MQRNSTLWLRALTFCFCMMTLSGVAMADPCVGDDCGGEGAPAFPAESCFNSADCEDGFECIFYEPCNCGDNEDCACTGTCEWAGEQEIFCYDDSDCGSGQICDYSQEYGRDEPAPAPDELCAPCPDDDPDCEPCGGGGGGEAPGPDGGICRDADVTVSGECSTSADCEEGYVCQVAESAPCAPGEACDEPQGLEGMCVLDSRNCQVDSDCPTDWTCEAAPVTSSCGEEDAERRAPENDDEDGLVAPDEEEPAEPLCDELPVEPMNLCVPPDGTIQCEGADCSVFPGDDGGDGEGGGEGSSESGGCSVQGAGSPAPSAAWLLVLGLVGMFVRRRK